MPNYEGIPYDLIVDGKIMFNNLKSINKTYSWLKKQVNEFNLEPKEVLLATIDGKGQFFCQGKKQKKG